MIKYEPLSLSDFYFPEIGMKRIQKKIKLAVNYRNYAAHYYRIISGFISESL